MQSKISINIGNKHIDFLAVPAGEFLMGSTKDEIKKAAEEYSDMGVEESWLAKEYPQHKVNIKEFYISKTLLTNSQWSTYLNETKDAKPEHFYLSKPDHPVWGISFDQLSRFCKWLSSKSTYEVRPPTEEEWEKAARGTDGREYPWGNEFDRNKCNTREENYGDTTPVGKFLNGASPYGVLDMAGNVEEWTSTVYQPYHGGDPITDRFGGPGKYLIIRGGSFRHAGDLARCARRHGPYEKTTVGARLVITLS